VRYLPAVITQAKGEAMNGSQLLDPQIAALAGTVPIPTITADVLPGLRGQPLGAPVELSDQVERTDYQVSADPHVVVRVHRRKDAVGVLPGVYSIHGGGYVLGSYAMDDARFDRWCQMFPCVGVSVEYRLAPETPYPGPLDDCYAGLRWTVEHADELGIDPNQIGLVGTSAGGGLAAGLALLARDRGEIALQFQLLECPMIDDRRVTHSSQLDALLVWSRESNQFGWQAYLGDLYGAVDVPYYAAASRCPDLDGLPPSYVCVGGADGFRDEDIEYALRLNQASVPTELHVYPGAPHGVGMFAGTDVARRYQRDMDEWLGRQLAGLTAT
jgi:acetyl esterase/lipase